MRLKIFLISLVKKNKKQDAVGKYTAMKQKQNLESSQSPELRRLINCLII